MLLRIKVFYNTHMRIQPHAPTHAVKWNCFTYRPNPACISARLTTRYLHQNIRRSYWEFSSLIKVPFQLRAHYFNHRICLFRRNSSVNRDYDYDEKWNNNWIMVAYAGISTRPMFKQKLFKFQT